MVNWLVIGIGDIATKRVIPAILEEPGSELHAVVTRTPQKAAAYKCRALESIDAALEDRAISAIYVATPVCMHAQLSEKGLRAGIPVLCEKPMAVNYAEAERMAATAQETGVTLGVAYYRRLYPVVARAKEIINSGAIGQPVLAYFTCHSWVPPTKDDFWRLDPKMAGGGPLYDIASHRIDLLNFLFGKPVAATGQVSNAVHQYEVEDNATVLIEYPGGVRGLVDVRWHSQVDRDECRIVGTESEINMTPLNSGRLTGPGGEEFLPPHPNLHYPLIADFVDALQSKRQPISTAGTALPTDWVTQQVMRTRAAVL